MNHAPGPFSIRTYGYAQDIKAGTEMLATVHHLGTDREAEQQGNAHLIAAAPNMLKDLKAAKDFLFALYDKGNAEAGAYAASIDITINEAEGKG